MISSYVRPVALALSDAGGEGDSSRRVNTPVHVITPSGPARSPAATAAAASSAVEANDENRLLRKVFADARNNDGHRPTTTL